MELRHLRYFVAVAEELHFTRAAERLHMGQPPLSQQIRLLEEEVGARLLERTRRWVRLTEAGRLFLADARRILALADQASATARRAERGEVGELRIGFTASTPLTDVFNRVVNTYRKQYPQVTLTMIDLTTMRQLQAITDRVIDLGFLRPPAGETPPDIRIASLRQEPLMLVAPAAHPLLRQREIGVRDLASHPFVTFLPDAGTGIQRQVLQLCREAGFAPEVALQAGEGSTIIGLVAAGCGISILPESFSAIRVKGVRYRRLVDAGAVTELMLACRAGESGALVQGFFEMAQRVGGEEELGGGRGNPKAG